MKIVACLSVAVLLSAYLGWGVLGLLRRSGRFTLPGLTLPFGYAFGQTLFFAAYFMLQDAQAATLAVFAAATVPNLLHGYACLRDRLAGVRAAAPDKPGYSAVLTGILVMVFAAIPYLGSGFGNYWHSANEDIFDALNGRDAYLRGDLFSPRESPDSDMKIRGTLMQQQLVEAGLSPERSAAFFRDRYARDLGRLQYSSLAFWSVVLRAPTGMDAFLIQALLNLALFALGVFVFAGLVFGLSKPVAGAAALMAAGGNFYLSTYINGHEGSLMYNAAAPFLLYCGLALIARKQAPGPWLVVPGTLLLFIIGAYPYTLPFLAVPVFAYALVVWLAGRQAAGATLFSGVWQIITRPRFILLAGMLLLAGSAVAWLVLEPTRLRAMTQFRTWGTINNYVGILQFWGLWPSNLANISTPLVWLNQHAAVKIASLGCALLLTGATVAGCARLLKNHQAFLLVWLPGWVAIFALMRFAVYDSYYVYKFVYINAWLIIIPTIIGLLEWSHSPRRGVRAAGWALLAVWAGANVLNSTDAFRGISQRPYNAHYASYQLLATIPKALLSRTYIDVPATDHYGVVRQALAPIVQDTQQNKGKSSYLLSRQGIADILPVVQTPTVWSSPEFILKESPRTNLLEVASYWDPEIEPASPAGGPRGFRWVSDARNGYLVVDIHQRDQDAKLLYLCAESGPSVDFQPVHLQVMDADQQPVGTMEIGPYGCHAVNLEHHRAPFTISHRAEGRQISAVEPRKLVYRVFRVGVAPDEEGIRALENTGLVHDIIPLVLTAAGRGATGQLTMGRGWYPLETFAGATFRWVGGPAELVLQGGDTDGIARMALELEPGPSHGGSTFELEATDPAGRVVAVGDSITGRNRIILPLSYHRRQIAIYTLRTKSQNLPVPGETRILNYRVFKIEIEPTATP